MGRRDSWSSGWNKQQPQGQREADSRPWRLWQGAWSASPKGGGGTGQRQRYDQMPLPADTTTGRTTESDPERSGRGAFMKEIQRIVTAARKADGRVRRLQEERSRREVQWKEFERKSRADFLEEKQKYTADLQRLEDDIEAAKQQGADASEEVQTLVATGMRAREAPQAAVAPDDWDALITAEGTDEPSGFLRDALVAAERARGIGPPLPMEGGGRFLNPVDAARVLAATLAALPPGAGLDRLAGQPGMGGAAVHGVPAAAAPPEAADRRGSGDVDMKPAYSTLSPGAAPASAAPFPPASPSSHVPDTVPEEVDRRHLAPVHPGQRDPSLRRVPTTEEPPRSNIKDATKQSSARPTMPGTDLKAKLDARRAELEGTAMQPFRGGAAPNAPPGLERADAHAPEGAAAAQNVPIIQDDDLDQPGPDG